MGKTFYSSDKRMAQKEAPSFFGSTKKIIINPHEGQRHLARKIYAAPKIYDCQCLDES